MIYAFDTYYFNDFANTICIAFEDWSSEKENTVLSERTAITSDYESGAFYKRELPCIMSLLEQIQLKDGDMIIVDGYVTLNDHGKIGLGGYLFEALGQKYPVIGIAKNGFSTPDSRRRLIYRGESKTPLFLTAMGIDVDVLVPKIKQMYGLYRIPALLKKLDQLTRV